MTRTAAALLAALALGAAALGAASPAALAGQAAPAGAVVLTADQLDGVTAGGTRTASSPGSRESTRLAPVAPVEPDGVTVSGSKRLTTGESS